MFVFVIRDVDCRCYWSLLGFSGQNERIVKTLWVKYLSILRSTQCILYILPSADQQCSAIIKQRWGTGHEFKPSAPLALHY